jgi:hypothetical protein
MTPWRSYMLISGAPLTDDGVPSTPSADRVFTAESGQSAILVQLLDGTSATATVWTYAAGAWAAVAGATGAIGTSVPLRLAVTAGQPTFIQLTSVVGAPTGCVVLPGDTIPDVLKALLTRAALTLGDVSIHADVDQVEAKLDTNTAAITALNNALKAATQAATITPHDTNTITATRGLFIGGAGNLVAKFAGDAGTTTLAVQAGYYPFSVILVHTTSTATGMVALY